MEYLLSPVNRRILESFCLVDTIFAFDYDGTLAPICEDPDAARMKPEVAGLLGELIRSCPVAIISGRSVSDLRKLLPLEPHCLIGNHGSEGLLGPADLDLIKRDCGSWLGQISKSLPVLEDHGIRVEDKGLSLTFHYRASKDSKSAREVITEVIRDLPRARISGGKQVVNLVHDAAIHKGQALDLLMRTRRHDFGVYFGDDLTDEDVFRVPNPRLLTVKVGQERSLARYYVNEQAEIEAVLRLLLSFLRRVGG